VKQVQEWLGHSDPAFTMRTYVHLMDEGVGEGLSLADALRGTANNLRTGQAETDRNDDASPARETA
jgi:hypothetical protein